MGKSNKKKDKSDRINALRKQYDAFLEEDKVRKERNEYILGRLDNMRSASMALRIRYNMNKPTNTQQMIQYHNGNDSMNKVYTQLTPIVNRVQAPTDVPRLNTNIDENYILKEISKNYILIPKISTLNVDNNQTQPSDGDEADWMSKYEILDQLKKCEKGELNVPDITKERKQKISFEETRGDKLTESLKVKSVVKSNKGDEKSVDISTVEDSGKLNIKNNAQSLVYNDKNDYLQPTKNIGDYYKSKDVPDKNVDTVYSNGYCNEDKNENSLRQSDNKNVHDDIQNTEGEMPKGARPNIQTDYVTLQPEVQISDNRQQIEYKNETYASTGDDVNLSGTAEYVDNNENIHRDGLNSKNLDEITQAVNYHQLGPIVDEMHKNTNLSDDNNSNINYLSDNIQQDTDGHMPYYQEAHMEDVISTEQINEESYDNNVNYQEKEASNADTDYNASYNQYQPTTTYEEPLKEVVQHPEQYPENYNYQEEQVPNADTDYNASYNQDKPPTTYEDPVNDVHYPEQSAGNYNYQELAPNATTDYNASYDQGRPPTTYEDPVNNIHYPQQSPENYNVVDYQPNQNEIENPEYTVQPQEYEQINEIEQPVATDTYYEGNTQQMVDTAYSDYATDKQFDANYEQVQQYDQNYEQQYYNTPDQQQYEQGQGQYDEQQYPHEQPYYENNPEVYQQNVTTEAQNAQVAYDESNVETNQSNIATDKVENPQSIEPETS